MQKLGVVVGVGSAALVRFSAVKFDFVVYMQKEKYICIVGLSCISLLKLGRCTVLLIHITLNAII